MKGKLLCAAVLALSLFAGAEKASANTACFDWVCDSVSQTCDFDASPSSITSGSLWRFAWNFNGTGHLTGSYTVNDIYFNVPYPTVSMTMWLFGADPVSTPACDIVVWNAVSPPLPTYGRCGC